MPSPQTLNKFINLRRSWSIHLNNRSDGKSKCFTQESVENLCATRDLLLNWPAEFKLVVSMDWATVYTNDANLCHALYRCPQVEFGRVIRQAVVDKPKDSIVINNPKFKYRTFFRERKISLDTKSQLKAWIVAQQDQESVQAQASRALWHWLNQPGKTWRSDWCQRYFYIEHNNLQYETMLAILAPGAIRKSVPVIKRL